MTTTKINPRSMEVGPLPEVEPPPMVAGGQVWRNGFLVDAGPGYAVPRTEGAAANVVSVEAFIAQRRQQEEDILDAAARGDPALLFALLRWALRETSAPSHADLAEWMEEGRQRLREAIPVVVEEHVEIVPSQRKRVKQTDGGD